MPTQRKQKLVEQFTEDLSQAQSVVFTDFRGLSTAELEKLRKGISRVCGKYTITKNTLLRIAARKQTFNKGLADTGVLSGPTATLFSLEDEISAIKVLDKFIKDHEKPIIKGGLLGSNFVSPDEISELAKLPSFTILITQLIATLESPIVTLSLQLKSPVQKLVVVLRAITELKGGA